MVQVAGLLTLPFESATEHFPTFREVESWQIVWHRDHDLEQYSQV